VAKASGAGDHHAGGFTFITDASLNDFTSKSGLASAVGAYANFNVAGDTAAFAIKNSAVTKIGIFDVVEVGGDADNIDAAADTITLIAVIDVTSGTFGLSNMGVY